MHLIVPTVAILIGVAATIVITEAEAIVVIVKAAIGKGVIVNPVVITVMITEIMGVIKILTIIRNAIIRNVPIIEAFRKENMVIPVTDIRETVAMERVIMAANAVDDMNINLGAVHTVMVTDSLVLSAKRTIAENIILMLNILCASVFNMPKRILIRTLLYV